MATLDETPQVYPSIRQCWPIVGIVPAMGMACFPITKLGAWIGAGAASMIWYVSSSGLAFYFVHRERKRKQGSSRYDFKIGPWWRVIPLCLGTVGLHFGVIVPIVRLIPMSEWIKEIMRHAFGKTGVFSFLEIALAAPILEELIFRGIMLDGLLKRYKPLTAILVSSLFFGLVHLNPWQFVGGFGLGCFMGWVYLRSGSVAACILMHMSANGSSYLLGLFDPFHWHGAKPTGMLNIYGGGVLGFIAVHATLLTVFAISVYCLRREFDTQQHLLVRPDSVSEPQISPMTISEPILGSE